MEIDSQKPDLDVDDDGSASENGGSEDIGDSLSSSSCSSPLPMESLGPIFEVKGARSSPEAGVLTFTVRRLDDPENQEPWEVTRSYCDFEAFHRILVTSQKFEGIIHPPLPPAPSPRFDDLLVEGPYIHRKQIERY